MTRTQTVKDHSFIHPLSLSSVPEVDRLCGSHANVVPLCLAGGGKLQEV